MEEILEILSREGNFRLEDGSILIDFHVAKINPKSANFWIGNRVKTIQKFIPFTVFYDSIEESEVEVIKECIDFSLRKFGRGGYKFIQIDEHKSPDPKYFIKFFRYLENKPAKFLSSADPTMQERYGGALGDSTIAINAHRLHKELEDRNLTQRRNEILKIILMHEIGHNVGMGDHCRDHVKNPDENPNGCVLQQYPNIEVGLKVVDTANPLYCEEHHKKWVGVSKEFKEANPGLGIIENRIDSFDPIMLRYLSEGLLAKIIMVPKEK